MGGPKIHTLENKSIRYRFYFNFFFYYFVE